MIMMHKLFVYGTLKRGGRLHHHITAGNSKFLCQDSIPKCSLYKVQWYPGVKEGDAVVRGEVYEIDTLDVMDEVEGEGSLFKREIRRTEQGHDAWIYMYLGEVDPAQRIPSGVFDVTTTTTD